MRLAVQLNKMMGGNIERVVPTTDPNREGGILYKRYTFEPGEWFVVDDPISQQYFTGKLQDCRERQILSANLKAELESNHVPYETQKCGTCANAKIKAVFNPFVWKEVEDENA